MNIKYTLSVDDKIAFARLHLAQSPRQIKSINANRLAFTVGSVVLAAITFFFKLYEMAWGALMVALIVWLLYPWHHRRIVLKKTAAAIRKNVPDGFTDTIEMTSDESGLTINDGQAKLTAPWSGVLKQESSGDYTFVYLKGGNALIIPRHAISEGDYDVFVADLQERRKQDSI